MTSLQYLLATGRVSYSQALSIRHEQLSHVVFDDVAWSLVKSFDCADSSHNGGDQTFVASPSCDQPHSSNSGDSRCAEQEIAVTGDVCADTQATGTPDVTTRRIKQAW